PLGRLGAARGPEGRSGGGGDSRRHRRPAARSGADRRLGDPEGRSGNPEPWPLAPMEVFRAPRVTLIARPEFLEPAHLRVQWQGEVADAQAAYVRAVEALMQRYDWVADKVHRRKMAREAARSVLPNATEVKIVVSGNAHAWRTMLELRSGEGAELEIRRMAVA